MNNDKAYLEFDSDDFGFGDATAEFLGTGATYGEESGVCT